MKPPSLKRLNAEDFAKLDEDSRKAVGQLSTVLNPFLANVTNALSHNLTIGDNIAAWVREVEVTTLTSEASGGSVDASDVSVTPDGDLTSTNVQDALVELQGDIDALEAVSFWDHGIVAGDIHYSGGDVGVGTNNPIQNFHVREAPGVSQPGPVLLLENSSGGVGGTASLHFSTYNVVDSPYRPSAAIVAVDDGLVSSNLTFQTRTPGGGVGDTLQDRLVIDSDGDVHIDGTTFTVDATNNRVGINSASPTVELDVSGSARVTNNLVVDGTLLFADATNDVVGIRTNSPSPATSLHVSSTGADVPLYVDRFISGPGTRPSGVVVRASRGGAGSPSAVQSGDLIGGYAIRGYGATAYSSDADAGIGFRATQTWTDTAHGVNASIGTTPNGSTTLVERLVVDQNGDVSVDTNVLYVSAANDRVGVNNASPAEALDVTGNIKASGNGSFQAAGSTTAAPRTLGIDNLSAGNAARIQFGDANNAWQTSHGGKMQIYGFHGIEILGGRGLLTPPSFVTGSGTTDTALKVIGNGASNALEVSSGNLYVSGGNATVVGVVDVGGNLTAGNSNIRLRTTSGSNISSRMEIFDGGSVISTVGKKGSNTALYVENQTDVFINVVSTSNPIRLMNNGVEKMQVNSTGVTVTGTAAISGNLAVDTNVLFVDTANNRIGVNTASPVVPFELQGTAGGSISLFKNTNSAGWCSQDFYDSSGVYRATFGYVNAAAPAGIRAGRVLFQTGNTEFLIANDSSGTLTGNMLVKPTGEIGFGTLSPQRKAHFVGVTAPSPILVQNTLNSGWGALDFWDDVGTYKGTFGFANTGAGSVRAGTLMFQTGNVDFGIYNDNSGTVTTSMYVKPSGNVGFGGNLSPTSTVDITGTARVSSTLTVGTTANSGVKVSLGSDTANTKIAVYDNGSGSAHGIGHQTGALRIHNASGGSDVVSFHNGPATSATVSIATSAGDITAGGFISGATLRVGDSAAYPAATIHVVTEGPTTQPAHFDVYQNGGTVNSGILFRTARGTKASPSAIQNGDLLGAMAARGYGATGFNTVATGGVGFRATENWTDTAQGTGFSIATTPNGSTTRAERFTVNGDGDTIIQGSLAVSTNTANPGARVHVVNDSATVQTIHVDSYANGGAIFSGIVFRGARGTLASPTAVLTGDNISSVATRGYGATGFSTSSRAAMRVQAAEDWTDTAQGTNMSIAVTAPGTTTNTDRFQLTGAGNIHLNASGGRVYFGSTTSSNSIHSGTGDPNSVHDGSQGSLFIRTDGAFNTTLYVKTTSLGTLTGWNALN